MAILQKLTDLGFTQAEVTGEAKGKTAVRVRTSKGWVYERFTDEAAVQRWANFHMPENAQ